ncbi:hypothetical protein D0868_10987 [Hortaea werneckii]|uniref:Uncharacterized protein n=1 Tax=Hortaea werneckii TaxID=91943 RepID=A0A3M6Y1D5_HORWE|nr:hypothetical protein D0868_10987 [Hortaea werneckii]
MFNPKRVLNAIAPSPKQSADGRDQWPSRTSYVLASMGGAIGFGNLLRFPSQVFNNNGIQWFIPYVMAIFLLAIPILILEIATGWSTLCPLCGDEICIRSNETQGRHIAQAA